MCRDLWAVTPGIMKRKKINLTTTSLVQSFTKIML